MASRASAGRSPARPAGRYPARASPRGTRLLHGGVPGVEHGGPLHRLQHTHVPAGRGGLALVDALHGVLGVPGPLRLHGHPGVPAHRQGRLPARRRSRGWVPTGAARGAPPAPRRAARAGRGPACGCGCSAARRCSRGTARPTARGPGRAGRACGARSGAPGARPAPHPVAGPRPGGTAAAPVRRPGTSCGSKRPEETGISPAVRTCASRGLRSPHRWSAAGDRGRPENSPALGASAVSRRALEHPFIGVGVGGAPAVADRPSRQHLLVQPRPPGVGIVHRAALGAPAAVLDDRRHLLARRLVRVPAFVPVRTLGARPRAFRLQPVQPQVVPVQGGVVAADAAQAAGGLHRHGARRRAPWPATGRPSGVRSGSPAAARPRSARGAGRCLGARSCRWPGAGRARAGQSAAGYTG